MKIVKQVTLVAAAAATFVLMTMPAQAVTTPAVKASTIQVKYHHRWYHHHHWYHHRRWSSGAWIYF